MKHIFYSILLLLVVACSNDDNADIITNSNTDGTGGSLASFTLKNDYLYTVDHSNLNVFNVSTPSNPSQVNTINLGFDIETLFSYQNYLYIGSQTGMFIYSIENPEVPILKSRVEHFTACDPVIANATTAYVTLHSNTFCGNNINLLEIYDVTNVLEPVLINSRNLVAPKGLGLYGDYLFVCDDDIKIFDVSDPQQIELVHAINRSAFDVIIKDDLLIAIGEDGLYQYQLDPQSIRNIVSLSTIAI